MEWTCETGERVTWEWAEPESDEPRYAIRIHVDGRRLRGAESKRWKQRLEAEFPV